MEGSRRRGRRGRTFVDVLAALVTGGCLVVFSVPRLSFARARSASGAREVASTLALAQRHAVSLSMPCGVLFLTDPDRWLVWRDDDGDRFPDVQEILDGPLRLAPGSRFARPSGEDPIAIPGDRVIFRPSGAVSGLSGSVWVTAGDACARVTVLTSGRIRVYERAVEH